MHNFFGHGFWMWLVWIIPIVIIVALILLFKRTKPKSSQPEKSPIEILKERYARGEIDEEEFEKRKKELT